MLTLNPNAALRAATAVFLLSLLSGCAAVHTNNTSSDGADSALMLKGHDPVAYFVVGKHVPGKPGINAEHNGGTYRFASDENRQVFMKNPDRYTPQYGGFCSNGIVYGIAMGGDPDTWTIIDGRLFIFGGESSRKTIDSGFCPRRSRGGRVCFRDLSVVGISAGAASGTGVARICNLRGEPLPCRRHSAGSESRWPHSLEKLCHARTSALQVRVLFPKVAPFSPP